jgi:DNA-binding MarR family transcriptional regulator
MDLTHPLHCLTFQTQRAARSLVRGFEAAAKQAGLTAPQFTTLTLLAGFSETTVTQLAERLGTERTTLTRNLDVMARQGWIEEVAAEDQRLRVWRLTDDGRGKLSDAMPVWRVYQTDLIERLGPDRAEALLTTLKTL